MDATQAGDQEKTTMQIMQEFLIENPDLEQLEQRLNPFNIFEALKAVRVELRHSDFLAFLLDPSQNHGIGDVFVRTFLQKVVLSYHDLNLDFSPIDLELWDLNNIEVRREWQNIDIFLVDTAHQFVVIIENKIYSSEHPDQLQRYYQTAISHYPTFSILSLFLTPDKSVASDVNYLPIDYELVIETLEKLLNNKTISITPDVRTLVIHYTQMLRRRIVNNELAELCRRIYRKHKSALDLIYEYRPDQQGIIQETVEELIKSADGLRLIASKKNYISFRPTEWDVPVLTDETSPWKNILYFEFQNMEEKLVLKLFIGPGPLETRQKLYKIAQTCPPLRAYRSLGNKWNTVYLHTFLNSKHYEELEDGEFVEEVRKQWKQFIKTDLLDIIKIIKEKVIS